MTKGFKPTFTMTNRIIARVTRTERARGFLEAAMHAMAGPMIVRENSAPYGGEKP